jgi:hypothetical protein
VTYVDHTGGQRWARTVRAWRQWATVATKHRAKSASARSAHPLSRAPAFGSSRRTNQGAKCVTSMSIVTSPGVKPICATLQVAPSTYYTARSGLPETKPTSLQRTQIDSIRCRGPLRACVRERPLTALRGRASGRRGRVIGIGVEGRRENVVTFGAGVYVRGIARRSRGEGRRRGGSAATRLW